MRNIIIKGKEFKGTEDLRKLLTRKIVNYDSIDKNDLQRYKTILEMTKAHLKVTDPEETFRLLAEQSSRTL